MRKIIFKTLRWKNLLLTGDSWTSIDLNRSPSTLLVGKNGSGKSTAYEALHLCLFGTPIRKFKKKNDVVNNKNNKGTLIEATFDIGDDAFLVRRGFKPDVFEVEKNGALIDQEASVRDMQLMLNRDILKSDKVGFQITTQISKAGIQMFMSLKSEERRKFIDDMLECTVFTEMAKLHKGRFDALKSDHAASGVLLQRTESEGVSKNNEIQTATEMVATMATRHAESIRQQRTLVKIRLDGAFSDMKSVEADIEEQDSRIAAAEAQIADAEADIAALEVPAEPESPDTSGRAARAKKIKEADALIIDLKSKIRALENNLDLLKAGYCSSCKQEVSEDHVADERAKDVAKIDGMKVPLGELQAKRETWQKEHDDEQQKIDAVAGDRLLYERAMSKITAARQKLRNINTQIDGAKADKTRLQTKLATFTPKIAELVQEVDRLKAAESEPHEDASATTKLARLNKEADDIAVRLTTVKREYEELTKSVEYAAMIAAMLKDGGVKTVVVKKFLPIINRIVNEKLSELGFYGRFEMDENFDETIHQVGGSEMTFNQFSEGEKLRINLALIMGWREIAMLQGRMHSNLLMFDETLDASLDDDGYEALTEIFKTLDDLNVFIISHSPDRLDSFIRSKIQFVRDSGFSRIADVLAA